MLPDNALPEFRANYNHYEEKQRWMAPLPRAMHVCYFSNLTALSAGCCQIVSKSSSIYKIFKYLIHQIRVVADAMAEIGVIASGMGVASLAIQVADSLLKLKGFLDNVKEAPDEIKYLIEEIDTLGTLLSEFDADIPNGESELDSSSMRKCWEHCSRGLGILEAIVRELDMDIGRRRRIGSLKAALKTGSIKRLKDRLKSAQIMLLMAHQIYSALVNISVHVSLRPGYSGYGTRSAPTSSVN